ncbi:MAG: hypothetical protein ACMUIG_05890 [Thermoplasmatota archaeon]
MKAKAVLIDPGSMNVIWMNEAASRDLPVHATSGSEDIGIECVLNLAKVMDLEEILKEVSRTGETRHLRTDLISSSRGKMSVVSSVYPLPDGNLLILSEIGWKAKGRRSN